MKPPLVPKQFDLNVRSRANLNQAEWEYYIENMGKRYEDSQDPG